MKLDELKPLEGLLTADFRDMEPRLRALDKHLTLRSYLHGYRLSETDSKIWLALRGNRAATSFIRKGSLPNLARWFAYVEAEHPEIQADIRANEAAAKAKVAAASKAGGSFALALQNTGAGVVTRFLPEPSGYLHIGHAKAALLSDYFAHEAYDGKLLLRLDDTNPSNEKEEYTESIIQDLKLMGIKPDAVSYTSDHFDYLYDTCVRLLREGHAYADDTDHETMKKQRWDGIASKHRERPPEESLRIFEHEMKKATEDGLRHCIRAKVSADNPNKALRDPVIYRCNLSPHARTGSKYKMYPLYDLCAPVVDSLEGVTHALRSTEYTDRNPLYKWFLETLHLRQVHMWDFSRMNFIYTFLSKRKLAKLVDTGRVWGWDDPRMPTIRGVRRRGMTIPALREFIIKQGPSRNLVTMDWTSFWACNKRVIDPVAPRHTAVLLKDVVTLTLTGVESPTQPYQEERPKHPKNSDVGTKQVTFAAEILIDQADAQSFRPGEEITLMTWGNAIISTNPPERDLDRSVITHLTAELNVARGDFKATEKKITWLAAGTATPLVPADLWHFDHLLTKETLDEDDRLEDFLNPHTATVQDALCDAAVAGLRADDIIQLERRGYYRVDKGLHDWADGEDAGPKGRRLVLFAIPTGKTGSR